MEQQGAQIKALIEQEAAVDGISMSDIFLGGISQGGRMVWHTAFGQLEEAIGGYFSIVSCPQYPAFEGVVESEYSYNGDDMNWFVFMGGDDEIFPPAQCQEAYENVFEALGMSDALKYDVIAEGVGHEDDSRFYDVMLQFINEGEVGDIDDFESRFSKEWSEDEEKSDAEDEKTFDITKFIIVFALAGVVAYFML